MVSSILSELEVGEFIVKVSHRKLLDAMLTYCGVPKEKFHPICSAIDKLDKEPWDVVRAEMVDQKGLPADVRFMPKFFLHGGVLALPAWDCLLKPKTWGH